MENETKKEVTLKREDSTQKKESLLTNLILGIIFLISGLGLIIGAFIINYDKSHAKDWYIFLMYFVGAFIIMCGSGELYYYLQNMLNLRKMNVKEMSVIAILSALSVVLYYFAKFKLSFFPSWLDVQFSDFPALLVSFMYGPIGGCLTILIRFFCKLPGTSTLAVGEFADLLIGCTLCSVAGTIYKHHRSFKGAMCAMAIGMLSATAMATVANWLILIPAYVNIAGFPMGALVGAMSYIPGVTEDNFMVVYLFAAVIPFNLFRYAIVFLITLIIYKRLHMVIVYFTRD